MQTSSEVQGVKVGGKHIGQQQLSEQSSTQYATDVWENRIQTAGLLLLVGFGMFIWKNAYRHHRDKRLARIKEREWQEPP